MVTVQSNQALAEGTTKNHKNCVSAEDNGDLESYIPTNTLIYIYNNILV